MNKKQVPRILSFFFAVIMFVSLSTSSFAEDLQNEVIEKKVYVVPSTTNHEAAITVRLTLLKPKTNGTLVSVSKNREVGVVVDGVKADKVIEGTYRIQLDPSKDFTHVQVGETVIGNGTTDVQITDQTDFSYVWLYDEFQNIEQRVNSLLGKNITSTHRQEILNRVDDLNRYSTGISASAMKQKISSMHEFLNMVEKNVKTKKEPSKKELTNDAIFQNNSSNHQSQESNTTVTTPGNSSSNSSTINSPLEDPYYQNMTPFVPPAPETSASDDAISINPDPELNQYRTQNSDEVKKPSKEEIEKQKYANATLRFINAEKEVLPRVKVLLKRGEKKIGEASTNDKGIINLSGVKKGDYILEVLEVPSKYYAGKEFAIKLQDENQSYDYLLDENKITIRNDKNEKTTYKIYDGYTDQLIREETSDDEGVLVLTGLEYGSYYFIMNDQKSDSVNISKTYKNQEIIFREGEGVIESEETEEVEEVPIEEPEEENQIIEEEVILDEEKPSSKKKFIIGGILLIAIVGVGGYFIKKQLDKQALDDYGI